MAAFMIGERRAEPRMAGAAVSSGFAVAVPGARVVDVLDCSSSGLRIVTPTALRPGRSVTVRRRWAEGQADEVLTGVVLRAWVHRLGRQGVLYEAAVQLGRLRLGGTGV